MRPTSSESENDVAKDEYKGGAAGGKSGRGKPTAKGYNAPRDAKPTKLPKTGGKSDGWQVLGKITKKLLGKEDK